MVIRGDGLGASMSRYLIDRIEATPNIELMTNTEIVALDGDEHGAGARCAGAAALGGDENALDIRNVFLFVGADPATDWLDGCGVELDRGGFVVTGAQSAGRGPAGVGAGDVRARRLRRRRRALRLGQARRRRDRRGRAGGGGAARLSR